MILVGSQRAGAANLADHLSNLHDNDHVDVVELDGFMAGDLHGALQEIQAVSRATKCEQYMFSLSLNPPPDQLATEAEFREAADRAADALGLSRQPRAMVIHEKEGRRHAHVVWSRIDPDTLRAINLPHFKTRLRTLSRDLFLDHGWQLPPGLQAQGGKNPLNFTLAEWQQAKRQGVDPREIKLQFRQAWERSDSLTGLQNALAERGYYLARGDRRGIVAVDMQGDVYALSRWSGVKAKEVRGRCGTGADLRPVREVQSDLRDLRRGQMQGFIQQFKAKQARDMQPVYDERAAMVAQHRAERQQLKVKQAAREAAEQKARIARLNTGMREIWDRLTGRHAQVRDRNLQEAMQAAKRDQTQRDNLIEVQMRERQGLQQRATALRKRQAEERKIIARDVGSALARLRTQRENTKNDRGCRRERQPKGPRLTR